jgi:hypothetical protein
MPSSATIELSLEDKINHIFLTVNKIDSSLAEQQKRVTKLENTVDLLSKELLAMKILVNGREQVLRSNAIRIIGVPITEKEKTDSKFLSKKIFTKILCPILNAAKVKGYLIEESPYSRQCHQRLLQGWALFFQHRLLTSDHHEILLTKSTRCHYEGQEGLNTCPQRCGQVPWGQEVPHLRGPHSAYFQEAA